MDSNNGQNLNVNNTEAKEIKPNTAQNSAVKQETGLTKAQEPVSKPSSSKTILDNNAPYRANGSNLGEYDPLMEEVQEPADPPSWEALTKQKYAEDHERAKRTNEKIAKTAVKGAAAYFGGPVGEKVADVANNSGVLDSAYDKIADASAKMLDSNPLARQAQKILNKADDSGLVDKADSAIGMIGGKGASGASAAGAGANAAKTASSPQTSLPSETPNQAAKNASSPGQKAPEAGNGGNKPSGSETPAPSNAGNNRANNELNKQEEKKQKEKEKKKKGQLTNLIKTHPTLVVVLLVAGALALLFILLMALLLGEGGVIEEQQSQLSSIDTRYDFTKTTITLTNSYNDAQNRIELQQLSFEDLIKGAAYAELYSSISGLTKEQMVEAFSANMIVFRGLALKIGGYDSSTKEIEIQSGDKGVPYCDITYGCDRINSNGLSTYVVSTYSGAFKGNKTGSIPAASADVLQALNEAYSKTKYLVLVPSSFNQILTNYNFSNPPYNQTIRQNMITKAKDSKNYETIIKEISDYNNYKIYNLENYAMSYTYSGNPTYWWPIGGSKDNAGLYSGTTSWTSISSSYGSRIHPITGQMSFHSGIDIPASEGTPIIATRSGTVKIATYNSSYGNYVEIDHGDGSSSRYAHMLNNSIAVSVGQSVVQGQMIGKVGTTGSSTGNHLHFEIRVSNQTVNPTDYVNAQNQRPKQITTVVGVNGSSNAQSVCLTLKNTGFSNNAVSALMSNMYYESRFSPTASGDHGTSYGLFQWHNGRYTNLRNHCGSRVNDIDCQVDFLIYELKTSYKDVYSNLLSNASAYDMTSYFCLNFERPANRFQGCPNRASTQSATYFNYASNGCK